MAEEGCKLFVYGVDQNMANEELQGEFEKFGMVTDVYNTGKGFAFVTFDRKEDAENVRENSFKNPVNVCSLLGHSGDGRADYQWPAD